MRIPRPQPGPWPRLRLPRRTARLRLTLLYSGVFLLCAVGLLGLTYLLVAQGRPVSAEELLERVWDQATDPFTTTVKATINRLRAKLGDPPLIDTLRERGYRIGGQ